MKKTERLFNVVECLRGARNPITCEKIAHDLGVSQRTIYRDIKLLISEGLPIIGEVGIGYVIAADFDAPPIQFTEDELDLISIGLRIAYRDGDADMRSAADTAFAKIKAGLKNSDKIDGIDLYAPGENRAQNVHFLTAARHAVRRKSILQIEYHSLADVTTHRRVKPIALLFFREATLLAAYCETRQDFRNFRVDRIQMLTDTGERFTAQHYKLRKAYFDGLAEQRRASCGDQKGYAL